jgi:hypothetical protein
MSDVRSTATLADDELLDSVLDNPRPAKACCFIFPIRISGDKEELETLNALAK